MSGRARPPSTSDKASTSMDLPAPVSPVSTLNPSWSSMVSCSMRTRFRIARDTSTDVNRLYDAGEGVASPEDTRMPSDRVRGRRSWRDAATAK